MIRWPALVAAMAALAPFAAHAARGDAPFVVTYRCEGGRWLAVGYPAFRDARTAPVRLAWKGRTIELAPARAGSGARYTNSAANLEWWSKGNGGFLNDLRSGKPLLKGCTES